MRQRSSVLEEQLLEAQRHDRSSFDCGVPPLNDYLHRLAAQHQKKGISTVRVLVDSDAPPTILGYYSLSAAHVAHAALPAETRKTLPPYPVPCFRLGRLVVDLRFRGQGLGQVLVGLAVQRCLQARQHVAAFAMLVDAKDTAAQNFYLHYGFTPCADKPMTLYLPLGRTL